MSQSIVKVLAYRDQMGKHRLYLGGISTFERIELLAANGSTTVNGLTA